MIRQPECPLTSIRSPNSGPKTVGQQCASLSRISRFAPRIRDLPSKRLYAFNPSTAPAHLRALIGGKINQAMIERNWPDILRIAATIAAGSVAPSQILRKLASYLLSGGPY